MAPTPPSDHLISLPTVLALLEADTPLSMSQLQRMLATVRRVGRPDLWWSVAQAIARHRPPRPRPQRAIVRVAIRMGDPVAARLLFELADLADDPEMIELHARASALHARQSPREALRALAEQGPEGRLLAAELACSVGDASLAIELYTLGRAQEPGRPEPIVGLARMALWGMDLDEARALAALVREEPGARRVLAACDLLAGDPAGALVALERLIEEDPSDGEAKTWRAEALLRLGRHRAADQAAREAQFTSRGLLVPSRVISFLARAQMEAGGGRAGKSVELDGLLEPVAESASTPTVERCERALEAFGGNRTPGASWLVDGQACPYPTPIHPRTCGQRAQMVLKTRGPQAALATFDDLLERHGDHPHLRTYRAELLLWLGRWEAAATDLRQALAADHRTVWAWVGLGATFMLQGDHRQALATWEEGAALFDGFVGPTTWAYRAEAYRKLGELDQAETNLVQAVNTSSRRLGTWINRALLDAARGDLEPATELAASLHAKAPGLTGSGEAVEQLERALVRMRGNRSSSLITWFADDGHLRILHWHAPTGR